MRTAVRLHGRSIWPLQNRGGDRKPTMSPTVFEVLGPVLIEMLPHISGWGLADLAFIDVPAGIEGSASVVVADLALADNVIRIREPVALLPFCPGLLRIAVHLCLVLGVQCPRWTLVFCEVLEASVAPASFPPALNCRVGVAIDCCSQWTQSCVNNAASAERSLESVTRLV
jgi:hypothetical protein